MGARARWRAVSVQRGVGLHPDRRAPSVRGGPRAASVRQRGAVHPAGVEWYDAGVGEAVWGVRTPAGRAGEVGGAARIDATLRCVLLGCAVIGLLRPSAAAAIPVFARVYGKPCHACHTVYPQLNPAGEAFRAHGLHGLKPVIEPIDVAPYVTIPGTLPLALQFAVGEDVTHQQLPGQPDSTRTHFNFEFLSLLSGGEIGPYLSFMADYAPLVTNPQTGEILTQTRPGLAFLEGHVEPYDWLANLKLGLFELPLGESPRVHRLSVRPYLIYGTTAFSLLGQAPPVTNIRTDSLVLASAQIGTEAVALDPETGFEAVAGVTTGSNNRIDNNDSADLFLRVGQELPARRAGLFLYYGPDTLGDGVDDRILRLGPDLTLSSRRTRFGAQFLAGYDSNPTGHHDSLWYYGGFLQGDYRFTPALLALLRFDCVGMPDFDDRSDGGTTHIRRRIWEVTAGAQYLIEENLKLVAEVTYAENHEIVSDTTATGVTATLRIATAFWPLTPPIVDRWLAPGWPQ
jgi:hypothetical protein